MKISHLAISALMVLGAVVAVVPAVSASPVHNETCNVGSLGIDHSQKNIKVNGSTATVKFAVKGVEGCTQDVTFASWEAPNLEGLPISEQVLYDFVTGNYPVGIHEVSVDLPVCETNKNIVRFYQADLLRGANPTTVKGDADYGSEPGRLIDWKHGGEECPEPVKPEKPSKKVEKVTVVTGKTIPNTGAASVIAPVLATGTLAGVAHNLRARRNRQ